jgi:hypothetical protein
MQEHKDQRINLFIKDEADFIKNNSIKFFNALKKEHPELDFAFKLTEYYISKEVYEIIHNSEIKHKVFFSDFVDNWDTLWGFLFLGVSDIYIVEELGFELNQVAEAAHAYGTQVRVFPNIAQSSWTKTPALMKFFIRPDDVETYEPYVDVMEFLGKEDSIETYYKIYAIDKAWFGPLKEVIIGFDGEIDSRFILPIFAEWRIRCGKRCLKGHPCKICKSIEDLSMVLKEKNLMIKDLSK